MYICFVLLELPSLFNNNSEKVDSRQNKFTYYVFCRTIEVYFQQRNLPCNWPRVASPASAE